MSEKSRFEGLESYIIGNNEDQTRRRRQYDLYAPTNYLEGTALLVRKAAKVMLQNDKADAPPILRLGIPTGSDKKGDDLLRQVLSKDKRNPILLAGLANFAAFKDVGVVVCADVGPKLVHATRRNERDEDFLGDSSSLYPEERLFLVATTEEGGIVKTQRKETRYAAFKRLDTTARERKELKKQAAQEIAELVIEDLKRQIEKRGNTSWLFNNETFFPIQIPEKWQRSIGFEPFGRTLRGVVPEEIIDPGLNAIQREGILKRLAWIDDLFLQTAKLIKAWIRENFTFLLGDISQCQYLAAEHGIGSHDIPRAGVSFANPPVRENGVLNIYYIPYVGVLPHDRIEEAHEFFQKNIEDLITAFLKKKGPFSEAVDIFTV